MSRLQFVRPTQAEVQNQPIADEPDHGANGTATLGSPETVESFERRFADAETRFADVQTKLDRRAEELATQLAEAIRREQEACERAERAEENLEAERMRREREQKLRTQTSRRVEELTAALEAAGRDLGEAWKGGPDDSPLSETRPGAPPPADWYPDPQNETVLRYWDGEAWTDWTDDRWPQANNEPAESSSRMEAEQEQRG